MSFLIGNARIDENGNARNGAAGDQTGREVQTQAWYSYPWNCVVRAKDSGVAEKLARSMELACQNPNIGYDQSQRTTLYTKVKALGFTPESLGRVGACETDCSALVAVCVCCAGISVSPNIWTGNEAETLLATGQFIRLTDAKYTGGYSCLKRGDILINTLHHTAIALSTGASAGSSTTGSTTTADSTAGSGGSTINRLQYARGFDKALAGTYTVTASALYMRYGPDRDRYGAVTILKNGTQAVCYGYYSTASDGTKWLCVTAAGKTGYCSLKYLEKV